MDEKQKEFISFMAWKACVDAAKEQEAEDNWENDDWEDDDDFVVTTPVDSTVLLERKKREEEERQRIESLRMQSIPMPEKPEKKMEFNERFLMGFGIFCLCAAAIWAVAGDALYTVIELVAGIWLVSTASKQTKDNYEKKLADYALAQRDFPQYQRKMLARQKAEERKRRKY